MATLPTLNGPIPWPTITPRHALIRRAVVAALEADADLTALVGTRIYPLTVPEGAALPALCYQLISNVPERQITGSAGLRAARFQFGSVSTGLSDCESIAEALRQVLDGLTADWTVTGDYLVQVVGVIARGEHDLGEDPTDGTGASVFRTVSDYVIRYREPLPRTP